MKLNWRRLGALVAAVAMVMIATAMGTFANAPNTANVQSNDLLVVSQGTSELETVLELAGISEGGALAGATLATANDVTINTSFNLAYPNDAAINTSLNGASIIWTAINKSATWSNTKTTFANTSPPATAVNGTNTARNGPTVAPNNGIALATSVASNERRDCYGTELATS